MMLTAMDMNPSAICPVISAMTPKRNNHGETNISIKREIMIKIYSRQTEELRKNYHENGSYDKSYQQFLHHKRNQEYNRNNKHSF